MIINFSCHEANTRHFNSLFRMHISYFTAQHGSQKPFGAEKLSLIYVNMPQKGLMSNSMKSQENFDCQTVKAK